MTRNSKHLKRYAAPRTWVIPRKKNIWAVKSSPGPHTGESSMPLLIALRDIAKLGETSAEVRKILGNRDVMVDGRVRINYKHPVGLMDVISVTGIDRHFRVMLNPRGQIVLKPIESNEASWKLVRVMNKTTVKGGKVQLNLHDGKNILVKKDEYRTGDVLKISLPDLKIISKYQLTEDSLALLTGGAHIGSICKIKKTEKTRNPGPNLVEFHEGFSTIMDYVFVVGETTSEIGSAEVSII
ncbi:MAG: 30S ribosomal protein S4e [Thermoplasmatota archaeon]